MSVVLSPAPSALFKKTAAWPDPASLTSAAEITAAMRFYEALESQIDNNLDVLIANRSRLNELLDDVDRMLPTVGLVQVEAQELSQRIDNTAQVAERISGQVRQLDEEQSRVTQSIEMVQAVQDLKTAIQSIAVSIEKHDWESATRHIQRATAIDPKILNSEFAAAVVVCLSLSIARTVADYRDSPRVIYLNRLLKRLKTSAPLSWFAFCLNLKKLALVEMKRIPVDTSNCSLLLDMRRKA